MLDKTGVALPGADADADVSLHCTLEVVGSSQESPAFLLLPKISSSTDVDLSKGFQCIFVDEP